VTKEFNAMEIITHKHIVQVLGALSGICAAWVLVVSYRFFKKSK